MKQDVTLYALFDELHKNTHISRNNVVADIITINGYVWNTDVKIFADKAVSIHICLGADDNFIKYLTDSFGDSDYLGGLTIEAGVAPKPLGADHEGLMLPPIEGRVCLSSEQLLPLWETISTTMRDGLMVGGTISFVIETNRLIPLLEDVDTMERRSYPIERLSLGRSRTPIRAKRDTRLGAASV